MSNEQKHTPLPWINQSMGDPTNKGNQILAGKTHVATCHHGGTFSPNHDACKANSDFIALACNSHYDLAEALGLVLTLHCQREAIPASTTAAQFVYDKARAALAKAQPQATTDTEQE